MSSKPQHRLITIISAGLVALGALLLALSLLPGESRGLALPLVFLMLGGGLLLVEYLYAPEVRLAALLLIPGWLLLAFGVVFLLNTLTADWGAWAYAWMLLVGGAALGTLLAARRLGWPPVVTLVSGATLAASLVFFALFGAITGGQFIRFAAPLLLVLGGLALRWTGLYPRLLARLRGEKITPLEPGERGEGESRRQGGLDAPLDRLGERITPLDTSLQSVGERITPLEPVERGEGESRRQDGLNAPRSASLRLDTSLQSVREREAGLIELPVASLVEPPVASLIEPLTAREMEVLRLIDQGLSNAEIAARVTLAQSTVKTHINNIYGKLGVQTRTQALKRARELSLF